MRLSRTPSYGGGVVGNTGDRTSGRRRRRWVVVATAAVLTLGLLTSVALTAEDGRERVPPADQLPAEQGSVVVPTGDPDDGRMAPVRTSPGCRPAQLRPVKREPMHEAAGPYGFIYARVTTVHHRACTLPRYPVLVDSSISPPVRISARRGTVVVREEAPAVIRAGTLAIAVLQLGVDRRACRGHPWRAYREMRLDLGNGRTILLGKNVRTRCPLRVSAWQVRD